MCGFEGENSPLLLILIEIHLFIFRSLGAVYQREDEYNGIKGKRYVADFGDMSTNPKEKCFCPTPDTCLKKGAMDLFPCQGKPAFY